MTLQETLDRLYSMADESIVAKKEKQWGVKTAKSLGIHHKELKELAKEIKTNTPLALELIDSGVYEARLLASKIINPKDVTEKQMDEWVLWFENWEICDSFSMTVFARSPLAIKKIDNWHKRDEEYVKRAAFATMAAYVMADKKAENHVFVAFYPLIKSAADDDRTYVKKAVNWALRNIGKRNVDLQKSALKLSYKLLKLRHKSAQWIAKDAIKELEKEGVRISNYPRAIYG